MGFRILSSRFSFRGQAVGGWRSSRAQKDMCQTSPQLERETRHFGAFMQGFESL